MSFTVERTNEQVLTLRHDGIVAGWRQRYLLISDVHFDSPLCDRRLLTKLLDQARNDGAGIMCIGDWFDAMGGKADKRGNKSSLRAEDKQDNYFDVLVDHSAEYLAPYAESFLFMSNGNHETAPLKHNETNILKRLCKELGCQHMGYGGWVRFMMDSKGKGKGGCTYDMSYHHGSGGGGPVTKGVIQTNRRAASIWAHIYVSGHIHESWVVENVIATLTDSGREKLVTQTHIQLPTFKQEYQAGGYHIEKGRPPKPLGGYWLELYYDRNSEARMGYRVERAN